METGLITETINGESNGKEDGKGFNKNIKVRLCRIETVHATYGAEMATPHSPLKKPGPYHGAKGNKQQQAGG